MKMEVETQSSVGKQLCVDGVSYDVSNLLIASNRMKIQGKIYPTHLLAADDDELIFDDGCGVLSIQRNGIFLDKSQSVRTIFDWSSHDDKPREIQKCNTVIWRPLPSTSFSQRDENSSVVEELLEKLERLAAHSDSSDDDHHLNDKCPNLLKKPPPITYVLTSPKNEALQATIEDIDLLDFREPEGKALNDLSTAKSPQVDIKTRNFTKSSVEKQCGERLSVLNETHSQPRQHDYSCDDDSDDASITMDALMIEIAPGISECIRGSAETIEAHRSGNVLKVHCFCCDQDISCVGDAAYMLCPNCSVVSPVPEESLRSHASWGVGLGFVPVHHQQEDCLNPSV